MPSPGLDVKSFEELLAFFTVMLRAVAFFITSGSLFE